ncbi:MAG: hypothetical protein AAGH15_27125, partial [Myxococcota bacterium]
RGARVLGARSGSHRGGVHAMVWLAPDASSLDALVAALPAALGEARRAVRDALPPEVSRARFAAAGATALGVLRRVPPPADATGILGELAGQPALLLSRPRPGAR